MNFQGGGTVQLSAPAPAPHSLFPDPRSFPGHMFQ